ncbi:MAG: molybdate ABC transporter substrate-binding protein [Actinomycetota bacterium]
MRLWAGILVIAVTALAGCGSGEAPDGDGRSSELLVFAAASLARPFEQMADLFEERHEGADLVLHIAGSQRLAAQVLEGAPAGVFASADRTQMQRVTEAGWTTGAAATFARNRLAIVVAPGNPHRVSGPADLARADLTVVLADPSVPVGAYTRQMLQRADVEVSPASLELDTRSVLSRVALGEADAGVVYTSDLHDRDDVTAVALPDAVNVTAEYHIAVLEPGGPTAEAFVDLVRSPEGTAILARAGFRSP